MRFQFLLLLCALSADLSAASQTVVYSGKGTWRSSNPTRRGGSYTMTMTVTKTSQTETTVTLEYTGVKPGEEPSWSYRSVQRTNRPNFYDVYVDDTIAGMGYCYVLASKGKKCHYQIDFHGTMLESTFTTRSFDIFRMGSTPEGDGHVTIWREGVTLEDPPTPLK